MKDSLPFEIQMPRAACIIVDMQNDFVRKNAPLGVEDALTTIAPIQKVIVVFREAGRPVIFTPALSPGRRKPCCGPGRRRSTRRPTAARSG
ncbi:isochorismatase family protein [candidate division KSB3 bacterium]|uniref:Isochorismatase family protein n=1 Tax=candidate division KSB3 bacterium TaxID=2044937 RepID=A0A9D5Q8H1_9BACT|nr:isochorismatase family protein [candidate division KSB3 bacterium]MBD3327342.1 isochorismatase family protein [candidate division KSB3 bacterium]